MLKIRTAVGFVVMYSACAAALAADFDFKDPKGVNAMTFVLDSQVEPILGVASGVSGTVSFDPADPKKTRGKLIVATESLHTPNDGMTKTLLGPDWLDAKVHPTIEFAIKEVQSATPGKDQTWELTLAGDFTCRGVTKPLTVKVQATYLPGKLSNRVRGREGDLLILRTQFDINRKDFEIKPGEGGTVVAEKIEIRASIVGAAAKS